MAQKMIDRDMLIAFAIGRLSRDESLRVLAGIEKDSALSRELEDVLLVMRALHEEDLGLPDARRRQVISEPEMSYMLRLAAVFLVGLLLTVSASEMTKGRYHDLASVADVDFSGRWRGDDDYDDQIEWARQEFILGDCDLAIEKLERVVQTRPLGESMAVVHWMVGAMLLETSERSYLGLFPWYDESRASRAFAHLAFAVQSTNDRVVQEAHLLRMKSLLMLNKPQEAIKEGEEVVGRGGKAGPEVMNLIREIKKR